MDQNYRQLMEFLLPKGLLEYFDLIRTTQSPNGLHIYLEEKIDPPVEYSDRKLHSKGFLPEVRVQDFPIRENKVTLVIKRRRWEDIQTNGYSHPGRKDPTDGRPAKNEHLGLQYFLFYS